MARYVVPAAPARIDGPSCVNRQEVVTSLGQAFQQPKPSCMGLAELLFCW